MNKKDYREVLGQALKDMREAKGFSMYEVAQKGKIRIDQVKSVENGGVNYTIDAFLGYIVGSDLYVYFAEKENKENFPGFKEMLDKGRQNDPQ